MTKAPDKIEQGLIASKRPVEVHAEDRAPDGKASPESIDSLCRTLTEPEEQPHVVQDFTPFDQSLEWELSRSYWDHEGPRAFVGGDVPYLIHNDGRLSADAAELMAAQIDASDHTGRAVKTFRVLEVGAGSGLFAKQFLDALQRLSVERGRDYYQRTTYVLTDGSEAMLAEYATGELFDRHRDQLIITSVEAPQLRRSLQGVLLQEDQAFHAIFLNYLLDNLNSTVLRIDETSVRQLMVQACIDTKVELTAYTDLDLDEIRAICETGSREQKQALWALYATFLHNTRYDEVERSTLPRAKDVPVHKPIGDEDSTKPWLFLHSHGALDCLDEAIGLLAEGGFVLAADYGYDASHPPRFVYEWQHFGGSIAIGVNFGQFDDVYGSNLDVSIITPPNGGSDMLYRLIGTSLDPAVGETFKTLYDAKRIEALNAPMKAARELVESSQLEAARWKFREALEMQPYNWSRLEEIAGFLNYKLSDHEGAITMALKGLDINPLGTGLWNVLGDALYLLKRADEALCAYRQALHVNSRDVRSLLNVAWMLLEHGDLDDSLHLIAQALYLDRGGEYREALQAKQAEVLQKLSDRHREEAYRMLNRFRGHHGWEHANGEEH